MSLYEPYEYTKERFANNGIVIRAARPEDFKELCEMRLWIYRELDEDLWRAYIDNQGVMISEFYGPEHQDEKRRVYYTVEDTTGIVGSGGLVQFAPIEEPNTAELVNIVLKEGYRGRGLGEALVQDLLDIAVELNFESVYLLTRIKFEAANHLYWKLGFRNTIKTKCLEDENCIALELFF